LCLSPGHRLEHVADIKDSAPRTTKRRQARRNSLADKLMVEAKALAGLKVEKAAVEGEWRTAEADLGPVHYLATMLGADHEAVLRWFILVVWARPGGGVVVAGRVVGTVILNSGAGSSAALFREQIPAVKNGDLPPGSRTGG
jgi:hypothetical protein